MSRVLGPGVLAEQKSVVTTTLKWAGIEVNLEQSIFNDGKVRIEVITIANDPITNTHFGKSSMTLYAVDLSDLIDLLIRIRVIRDVENDKV